MSTKPAAILYAAKSTEDTRGSIPTQLQDARRLAEREGLDVVAAYQDENASAYRGSRGPGLEDARQHAERLVTERGSCALIVQHSDRLARGDARTAMHLIEYVLWAIKAGVTLRSVQDDDSVRDLLYAAIGGQRNFEDSKRKSAAVAAGKQRQFERGERLGGPVPDGLRRVVALDDRGKAHARYEPDPARSAVIERIFALSESGLGDPAVARRMNEEGYRTKANGSWTRRRVQDVLSNPLYAGRVALRRNTPDAPVTSATNVTALIEPERFDRIRALRPGRDKALSRRGPSRPGLTSTRYVLSKLARCGRCGEAMYATTSPYKRKDGTQARHYVCKEVRYQTGRCDAPKIPAERVDSAVVQHINRLFLELETWLAEVSIARTTEREGIERQLAETQARAVQLERSETKAHDRLTTALANDDALADTYATALKRIGADRAQLAAAVADLRAVLAALDDEPAAADAALDFWNRLAEAVRGTDTGTDAVVKVNARLRDVFETFVLDTVKDGVVGVLPVLQEDVVARYAEVHPVMIGPDGVKPGLNLPERSPTALFVEASAPPVRPLAVADPKATDTQA
jgi:site-specific DNA recombinase